MRDCYTLEEALDLFEIVAIRRENELAAIDAANRRAGR